MTIDRLWYGYPVPVRHVLFFKKPLTEGTWYRIPVSGTRHGTMYPYGTVCGRSGKNQPITALQYHVPGTSTRFSGLFLDLRDFAGLRWDSFGGTATERTKEQRTLTLVPYPYRTRVWSMDTR